MPLLPPSRLAELHLKVAAATQPATELEPCFANEIVHAAWEPECARANRFQAAAEPGLNNALGKQRKKLPSACASHVGRRPLVGSNKTPKPLNESKEVR